MTAQPTNKKLVFMIILIAIATGVFLFTINKSQNKLSDSFEHIKVNDSYYRINQSTKEIKAKIRDDKIKNLIDDRFNCYHTYDLFDFFDNRSKILVCRINFNMFFETYKYIPSEMVKLNQYPLLPGTEGILIKKNNYEYIFLPTPTDIKNFFLPIDNKYEAIAYTLFDKPNIDMDSIHIKNIDNKYHIIYQETPSKMHYSLIDSYKEHYYIVDIEGNITTKHIKKTKTKINFPLIDIIKHKSHYY